MASDVEFTILTEKEAKFIRTYFRIQQQFMPTPKFFKNPPNILFRRHAVSIIAKHWRSIGPDTFIPYLAMNYFDRYFSINKTFKEDVEGCNSDTEKVRLIAISCLSISAKLRMKEFSVEQFLRDNNLMITPQMIMRMEFKILHELRWKIRPVTPFTYLNFYYRYFKQFGGYKRRCINEIIVQAQGDHTFVHYPPTMIASTAFLAVSRMAYPTKYNEIAHPSALARLGSKEQVVECAKKIFNLCRTMKIRIEIPESGVRSALSKSVGVPQKKIEDRREKAAVVVDSSEEEEEGTALIRQKRNTDKTTGTSQVQMPVKMDDKSDKKGVATGEIEAENRRTKAAVVDSSEEEDGTALIRRKRNTGKTAETSQVQVPVKAKEVMVVDKSDKKGVAIGETETENRRAKAVVVDSSEKEDGTALIRQKRNTGKTAETSQAQVPVKAKEVMVVDKSDKKGVAIGETETENKRAKAVVVDSSEEESSEEGEETPLIRRKRNMGKTTETSQVPVKVKKVKKVTFADKFDKKGVATWEIQAENRRAKAAAIDASDKKGVATKEIELENRSLARGKEKAVEVTEISVEDKEEKARVEAIIRRALEKGKAVVGEEPQTQIEGSVSEILELVAPKKLMIFELKWPTEVPPLELLEIKQGLPEVAEEEEEKSQTQTDDRTSAAGRRGRKGCNIG